MPSKQSHIILPVLALLLGATLWGVFWYPLRLLEQNGLVGLWATLLIYGAALMVGLPVVLKRRYPLVRPGILLVLAFVSAWCNIAFILAILEGNVVRVTLLFFLSPLWTVILSKLLLDEPLTRSARITLLLALVGALVMLWDSEMGVPWPQGEADWLALSSGFAFALANVLIRKMHDVEIWVKTVSTWCGAVTLATVWILIAGIPLPEVESEVVVGALSLGAIGMVVMTLVVLYGVTHMPAHRSAVILLFELVVGAVSAQLLTDEHVMLNEWFGGLLIVLAGWYAARHQVKGSG
ncbi:MAG: DMT family transporter [Gammaproteobacteria bacterium]|nr:DMT family transporter [Gammaproteobacteria bacterium]